jgi:hypothetical protein
MNFSSWAMKLAARAPLPDAAPRRPAPTPRPCRRLCAQLAVCLIELWPEARACKHDGRMAAGVLMGAVVMGWTLYMDVG